MKLKRIYQECLLNGGERGREVAKYVVKENPEWEIVPWHGSFCSASFYDVYHKGEHVAQFQLLSEAKEWIENQLSK